MRSQNEFKLSNGCKIADFGCGPGLYATRLAKRGANVTGIDFSKRSIDYAKEIAARKQLNISYIDQKQPFTWLIPYLYLN